MPQQKTSIRDAIEDPPIRARTKTEGVLWIPGLLVLLLAVFMTFFEQYFLPVRVPSVGERSPQAIRAPYDFVFNEEAALQKVVEQELKDFVPIYVYDPGKSRQIMARWEEFFNGLEQCRETAGESSRKARACLKEQLSPGTSDEADSAILRYRHLDKVEGLLMTSMQELLDVGVLSDEEILEGTSILRLRSPGSPEYRTVSVSEIRRLSDARRILGERLELLDLSPVLREALLMNLSNLIEPNIEYAAENQELLSAIRNRGSEKKRVVYRRGDLLVPRGHVVTLLDVYRVQDCVDKSRPDPLLAGAGSFLPFFFLTLVFLLAARRWVWGDRPQAQQYLLLFFVMISVLLLAKAIYLFTNLDGVAIPVGASGLVVALLLELPTALLAVALTSIYASFLTTFDMGLFLYYLIGGTLLVLCAARTSNRIGLFFYSLLMGGVNVLLLCCVILLRDAFPNQALLIDLAPQAFLSAPGAWLLAVLVAPLGEKLFGLATADRLRDLADLNHPLLKKLQEKAPGTYYHSLGVANLASVAAEVVGADVHLVRAGAYYHDIGKIVQPEFFIENQNNRENPHDAMDPNSSCEILKAHVRDGIEIAEQYRLPRAVVDLIAEHHGTTVLEAFYSKAKKDQPGMGCSPDFFRYGGPKPRRVESGIMMIADVVEAVGRLLTTTDPIEVRREVHQVVVKKFGDGQFDECGLSTRNLARMESAIAQTLLRILHKRIDYPVTEPEKTNRSVSQVS
ncbi:MAG: HD family phosphohydrolase [Thermodesulfobacteriota bacterium]